MKNSRNVKLVGIKQNWSTKIGKFQPRKSIIMRASDLRWAELLTNATEARKAIQKCMDAGEVEPRDMKFMTDENVFECVRILKKICDDADKEEQQASTEERR